MNLEWLILADGAQVVEGKLYLLGGGWDVITVNTGFPTQKHLAVAASFRVPWLETNEKHHVEIEIADADGGMLARVEGQVIVGRPAGIPVGQTQRVQFAFESVLPFEKPGTYVIIARINDVAEEQNRTTFTVVQP